MMRFQVPPRADSLNHTPIRHVNNLLLKLIDGKNGTPFSDVLDAAKYGDYGYDYFDRELSLIIEGKAGNDTLLGSPGEEGLFGDDGDDTLYGEGNRDMLIGGLGKDDLYGHTPAPGYTLGDVPFDDIPDYFTFDIKDSGDIYDGKSDIIHDFRDGDSIELRGFDGVERAVPYNFAGDTNAPGDGEYSEWKKDGDWVVTWNSPNDDGYHDVIVKGTEPGVSFW
jgi:hypothetical protein